MKIWHRCFLGFFSMAVAGSLAWGLLSLAPMPAAGAPSGLPLHLVLVNLAYNPLLSR